MARKLRVQYAGATYQVLNGGDRPEPIVKDHKDRLLFPDALAETCAKSDCQEPRGWRLGSDEFRQELLGQVGELANPRRAGQEVRQSALATAQRTVGQELEAAGSTAQDLQAGRKTGLQNVRIAAQLRREATMTPDWIAERLCMVALTHVAWLLQRHGQEPQKNEETSF